MEVQYSIGTLFIYDKIVPHVTLPQRKDFVPSIGSINHKFHFRWFCKHPNALS
ncbi:MAG: hypothetical protein ACTS42_00180 [Candidatus Hodgkinia cicadicola]